MTFDRADKIMVLGSCFAAGIGQRLSQIGYNVCVNPFGTLFNPVSIHNSIERLRDPKPFVEADCVQMGAGSELWGSFSHYTKFARSTKEEFLRDANKALAEAAAFYKDCTLLILTFGTAYCFRHKERDIVVSNCLKRPAAEFERFMLSADDIATMYRDLDKDTVLTVSPIRHLADGAHGNQLSKATLLMAADRIVSEAALRAGMDFAGHNDRADLADHKAGANLAGHNDRAGLAGHKAGDSGSVRYFPAYEIMLDELRDYRWYAEDGVHPSIAAQEIIFDRFLNDF